MIRSRSGVWACQWRSWNAVVRTVPLLLTRAASCPRSSLWCPSRPQGQAAAQPAARIWCTPPSDVMMGTRSRTVHMAHAPPFETKLRLSSVPPGLACSGVCCSFSVSFLVSFSAHSAAQSQLSQLPSQLLAWHHNTQRGHGHGPQGLIPIFLRCWMMKLLGTQWDPDTPWAVGGGNPSH